MHVLVTGGAGFIGSHLVEQHLNAGDMVHVIDNLYTSHMDNVDLFAAHPNYRFTQDDLLTWPDLEKAAAWADRIYHMAAIVGVFKVLEEPVKVLATNIAGTERLLRAANKSGWKPRIIIASSSEVYGDTGNQKLQEDMELHVASGATSRWNYSISKLADEALGLSFFRKNGLPVTLVRFFNTIGPRQSGRYGMVLPRFVQFAVNNEPITIFGNGEQTRSFCDVRDTVRALDALCTCEAAIGEIVNVGNLQPISIKELADLVKEVAGSSAEHHFISYEEAYGQQFDDIHHRRPDLSKLIKLTKFKHHWLLRQTIEDLVKYARQTLKG